jgi:hypothetical protein
VLVHVALQILQLLVFQIRAHTTAARTAAGITHVRAATAAAKRTTRMTMGGMGATCTHGAATAGDLRPTATDEQRMCVSMRFPLSEEIPAL